MAMQNVGATGIRDANQDQPFRLFSCLPTGTHNCQLVLAETSVGRRYFGSSHSHCQRSRPSVYAKLMNYNQIVSKG